MRQTARLEPLEAALDDISLIEANAGTGKTWTITALYLRLLLETERTVESILVVTFTEIATAELRARVRERLAEARDAFERSATTENQPDSLAARHRDPLLAGLLARISDHPQAALKLTSALRDFDQAPIYTIHAFCQRVLGDRAFESAMPFETRILPDESLLLQQIADDFWRRTLYDASPLFVRCVLEKNVTPERLRVGLNGAIGKPYLAVRKPDLAVDVAALEAAYERAYHAARAIWRESRDAISKQLVGNPDLHGGKYRADHVRRWLEEMARCLEPVRPGLTLFERFDKFTPAALAEGAKNGTAPRHRFYEACGELRDAHAALRSAYDRRLSLMKAELLEFCHAELVRRKERLRLQSYDDLLLDLERALRSEHGPQLAQAIRGRYTAALIDEFQDTDPVQYRIFRTLYRDAGLPVLLVGDPKQSIYSFRGADIFAYLDARRDARHHHTLDLNWRSAGPLLAAVNGLFARDDAAFVISDIPFVPSQPAPGERGYFEIEEENSAPLEFWLACSHGGKPLRKEEAVELAAEATAAEIARLLRLGAEGKARLGVPENGAIRERPLAGGDIAVLVRRHHQAHAVADALRRRGIASVERGGDSVFETPEAEELQRVLMAIAEPGREAFIRAALATAMIGYSGTALHALGSNEARWEEIVERFRNAHNEWRARGFVHMTRRLFGDFAVLERLLAFPDGERRVTNILHLVELMHRDAAGCGVGAALQWLAEKRRLPSGKNEEELLRLESDENLVKILTVHAAKGLEFPLVFCPFAWDGGLHASRDAAITFHDPENSYAAVLDVGSDALDARRPLAEREELAESLRLLYVALTRARYRCWVVWGNVNDAGTAALAWLLHRRDGSAGAIAVALGDAVIRDDLERIAASASGNIRVRPMPRGEEAVAAPPAAFLPELAPRDFHRDLRDTWRVTSFSALAHARPLETPDYDTGVREVEGPGEAEVRDIHAFPRGARTGRCLHAIFEEVDFPTLNRAGLERTVARHLAAYGFSAQWAGVVSDMIERVLATPLDETGSVRLDRVTAGQRLSEVEFYYPIAALSDARLRTILLEWDFPPEIRERIGALEFARARGYMKGYIDLVFESGGRYYLADYKSNWLGPTLAAYGQEALQKAMAREAYYLQYLVYCIALHRYLGARIPGYRYESHFGGVRYLFVRGMAPELGRASGVYADRPAPGLIHALDRYLAQGAA